MHPFLTKILDPRLRAQCNIITPIICALKYLIDYNIFDAVIKLIDLIWSWLKYQWTFMIFFSPLGFDYHAFIIFSSKDLEWVKEKLLRPLEDQYHLKCCVHYRDFHAGAVYLTSIAENVERSFKIIAVYSKDFHESNCCKYELDLAKDRQAHQRDDCLVIIRIDETEFDKLPQGLRGRSVIDYSKAVERPFWMGRLLQFLQVPGNSDNQDVVTGQDRDNNNRRDSGMGRIRNSFVRLNSTSSNESAVSFL